MTIMIGETPCMEVLPGRFEDLQKELGQLTVEERFAIDMQASDIFEGEAAATEKYGPNSPEAAGYAVLVLLASCLQTHSTLNEHSYIPPQRLAS